MSRFKLKKIILLLTKYQLSNQASRYHKTKKPVKILFVGDMMFDRYIREGVEKYGGGDYNYVFSQIKDKLAGYDLVVGNLEGPITDKNSVSVGTAMDEKKNLDFYFRSGGRESSGGKQYQACESRKQSYSQSGRGWSCCRRKNIWTRRESNISAIQDDDESRTLVKNIGGIKIGFVNYNYSIAGSFERAIEDIKNIRKAKSDIVIVCPHWGTEYKIGDPGQEIRS